MVTDWELVNRFSHEYVMDSEDVEYLSRASEDQGINPISNVLGSVISHIAASTNARSIIEVGTGVGVTLMRLAEACPQAHITTIDRELDHHVTLRELLGEVEVDQKKLRLITERAQDVLPKMNEDSYDLVVIDLPGVQAEACYDDAVKLCRPGGSILVARALSGGEVANPANRDDNVAAMRSLLRIMAEDDRVSHSLLPFAEGLAWAIVHPAEN
jgi:predicted O-methyltransferase YrrM